MNSTSSDHANNVALNIMQSPRKTPTADKSDAIFAQLWILLVQLEEINIWFALLLDTLTIPKPTTTSNNPSGNQLHQLGALNMNTLQIFMPTSTLHDNEPAFTPNATLATEPMEQRFPLLLPSGRQTLTVCIPPWPPQCHKHHAAIKNFNGTTCRLQPASYSHCLHLQTHATPTQSHLAIPCIQPHLLSPLPYEPALS